jgi:hypothetical protein
MASTAADTAGSLILLFQRALYKLPSRDVLKKRTLLFLFFK